MNYYEKTHIKEIIYLFSKKKPFLIAETHGANEKFCNFASN